MRWSTGTKIVVVTLTIAVAIVLTAAAFPGFLPKLPVLLSFLDAHATLLIALFTGALFISTSLLWDASERQISATRDAINAVRASSDALAEMDRAYVFLGTSLGHLALLNDGGAARVMVDFAFKNYGRTPAIVLEVFASIQFCSDGCPENRPEPYNLGPASDGITLSGGEERRASGLTLALSADALEQAYDGDGAVIFWGEIVYNDMFARKWRTQFAREVHLFREKGKSPVLRMAQCAGLNVYAEPYEIP